MASATPVVEFLGSTSIGEKGQLTVPKQFRDDLQLKPGAPVAILRMGRGLILIPEQERFEQLCERVSSALTSAGITLESALEPLPAIREQIYEKHYGKLEDARKPNRSSKRRKAQ
jgi:AbrB family looped-hinge helix DNA binding protein